MEFTAVVELNGRTATGIEVPDEVIESLGGRRVPVVVTIGGHSYRSTVGSMGGRSMIPVSAEHRAAAGVSAGDTVEVTLEPDTQPRVVEPPEDLAEAWASRPEAKAFFETLSPSQAKAYVDQVIGAKKPETRAARVAKIVDKFAAHEKR